MHRPVGVVAKASRKRCSLSPSRAISAERSSRCSASTMVREPVTVRKAWVTSTRVVGPVATSGTSDSSDTSVTATPLPTAKAIAVVVGSRTAARAASGRTARTRANGASVVRDTP